MSGNNEVHRAAVCQSLHNESPTKAGLALGIPTVAAAGWNRSEKEKKVWGLVFVWSLFLTRRRQPRTNPNILLAKAAGALKKCPNIWAAGKKFR